MIMEKEGPNDGLVSVASAKWVRKNHRLLRVVLTACHNHRARISARLKM